MRVKETLPKLSGESFESIAIGLEDIKVVFDPVVDSDILERREDIFDLVCVVYFAFVEI